MEHWKRNSTLGVFVLTLLLLLFVCVQPARAESGTPSSTSQSADPAEYVGADTCKTCHEDMYKQFETTRHYRTLLDTRRGPAYHGCEACHGPGSEHVNAGGDPTKIFAFKGVSADAISNRCLKCHNQDQERFNFRRSAHHNANVACTECHDPHYPKSEGGQYLMRAPQPQLCFGCHQELRSQFMRPFRHRVQEGLMVCTDCHNEHGTFQAKMLRRSASQDQVCFKCHTDKQGPFVFEHVPVKTEGCTICHASPPHGSSNPHMLKRAQVNQLCLECHTETVFAPGHPSFHNLAQKYQACTMCHTQIHGSNASEVFFK